MKTTIHPPRWVRSKHHHVWQLLSHPARDRMFARVIGCQACAPHHFVVQSLSGEFPMLDAHSLDEALTLGDTMAGVKR